MVLTYQTQKNGKRVYKRKSRDILPLINNDVMAIIGKEVENKRTLEYWKSLYPKNKKIQGSGKLDAEQRGLRMCLRSEIKKELIRD